MDHTNRRNSDGDTPQKQTEQILAVYPILPGQKPTEKNRIPPQHHQPTEQVNPVPVPAPAPVSAAAAPVPAPLPPQEKDKENLIDFSSESPAQYQHVPADLHAAQTQNNGQRQKDLEHTLQSTSTVQGQHQNSLIDFHDDLKRDLPAATETPGAATSTLYRQDTDTHSLDEFVDAEG